MTTEKQAARAAKQLLYHRRRINWIERRIEENEEKLVSYLVGQDAPKGYLPGGYEVWLDEEHVMVKQQLGRLYEQLQLKEDHG